MSAADRPSEYLKRTCLICGCNTNQTINIYEPRSGPNIVELIQAKFKFQPLNEDKYLCFSCNNWLINWHSLQANNSNDAESPSGTFRSSQVNGGMAQEKRATASNPPQQQKQQQQHNRQKQLSLHTTTNRPIAEVRPRQLIETSEEQEPKMDAVITSTSLEATISTLKSQIEHPFMPSIEAPKKRTKQSYSKRGIHTTYRLRRSSKKHLSHCCVCGRSIVFYIRCLNGAVRQLNKSKRVAKCRKCRSVCQWRSIYMRSLTKERTKAETTTPQNIVNQVDNISEDTAPFLRATRNQSQYLKRPLVDGKVVAMLRRLGTTLSREQVANNNAQKLPPIMSPTKPKPHWTRPLESDEILLNFETAISEVLPIVAESTKISTKQQTSTRRKLTYQMSYESLSEMETHSQECMKTAYHNIIGSLPKGLDISLV